MEWLGNSRQIGSTGNGTLFLCHMWILNSTTVEKNRVLVAHHTSVDRFQLRQTYLEISRVLDMRLAMAALVQVKWFTFIYYWIVTAMKGAGRRCCSPINIILAMCVILLTRTKRKMFIETWVCVRHAIISRSLLLSFSEYVMKINSASATTMYICIFITRWIALLLLLLGSGHLQTSDSSQMFESPGYCAMGKTECRTNLWLQHRCGSRLFCMHESFWHYYRCHATSIRLSWFAQRIIYFFLFSIAYLTSSIVTSQPFFICYVVKCSSKKISRRP